MEPCPAERTKRSRSNQAGLAGLWRRKRSQRTHAMGAAPMGSPGWPLFAFWMASTARKRIVLMQVSSMVLETAGLSVMVLSLVDTAQVYGLPGSVADRRLDVCRRQVPGDPPPLPADQH